MGHADRYDFSTEFLIRFDSVFQGLAAVSIEAFTEEFFRDADFHALDVIDQGLFVIFFSLGNGRRVLGIVTGDGIEDDGAVSHVVGESTNLVQGRRKGDEAITGNEAVCRFEADDTAVRSRLTDGSACIRAEGPDRFARSDSGGRTAGRTTGDAIEVPRVMSQLESRVFCRTAHGEFVHIGLAQADIISSHQFFDDRRIVRRFEIFQHLRCTRSLLAFDADVVLDGTGNPGEVTDGFTGCDFGIDSGSRFQGIIAVIR